MPASSGNLLIASSTVRLCARRPFFKEGLSASSHHIARHHAVDLYPSLIPRSAKALASALMAAFVAATAANPGFGSRAALPEINTTDPFEAFKASQARIVRRRAPCSLSAIPSSHCASVISNISICGTAPATLSSASILPKRSRVPLMMTSADCGLRRSRA